MPSKEMPTSVKLENSPQKLYLNLIQQCLTGSLYPDDFRAATRPVRELHPVAWFLYPLVTRALSRLNLHLFRYAPFDREKRAEGRDWPASAETMIGLKRLENIALCVADVIQAGVPGDLIETGVWRGGASILMKACLRACGDTTRVVWVADSFQGLPKPDGRYHQDGKDEHWKRSDLLGVPLERVKLNFAKYGLLDDDVHFLVGWFKDTLPSAPIQHLSILRLDGDMYSSTMDALQSLYPKLSPGGYTIIDDYGAIQSCKQAVDDYRESHRITTPLQQIDYSGVYWKKSS